MSFKGYRIKYIFTLTLTILVTGCVAIPSPISIELNSEITLQDVQQNTSNYAGQTVRWGGVITQVINHEKETWIEVLALELNSNARPKLNRRKSHGRFIAKVNQFLDPEIYQDGYSITFVGVIADKIEGKIGEFNYTYPVIEVSNHYLWPKVSYRRYPYITPGLWYYGINPFWGHYHGFGYGYYGYGVRLYQQHFYPYYPIYGYLERIPNEMDTPRNQQHTRSGIFIPRGEERWSLHTNPYWNSPRVVRNAEYRRSRELNHEMNRPVGDYPTMRPGSPRTETTRTTKPRTRTHYPRKVPTPIVRKTSQTK